MPSEPTDRDEEDGAGGVPPSPVAGTPSALDTLAAHRGRAVDPAVDLAEPETPERTTLAAPPVEPATRVAPSSLEPPGGAVRRSADDAVRGGAPTSRYEVLDEIGRGGMGAVLRVRDRDLRRTVAMKMLLPAGPNSATGRGPAVEHRFLEEAQITAQLSHPGVVPVHELGVSPDGRAFFTMAVVRGRTLAEVLAAARTGTDGWTPVRVLGVLHRVCETVAYAHERGVVHRDLKPANVMVGRYGEVYVMDWGLARVRGRADGRDLRPEPSAATVIDPGRGCADDADGLRTLDGTVLGTPAYMAPEQAEGRQEDVGPQSDVYALGAMLYELLAGHPPYLPKGARIAAHVVLACVVMGPPPPLEREAPDAPQDLRRIAERAMSRDPASRYASAVLLGAELQAYLDGVERARREAELGERAAVAAQTRTEALLSLVLDHVREPMEDLGRVAPMRAIAQAVQSWLDVPDAAGGRRSSPGLRAAVFRWLADVEAATGNSTGELLWSGRAAELAASIDEDDAGFRLERVRVLVARSRALRRIGERDDALRAARDALARLGSLLVGDDDDVKRLRFAAIGCALPFLAAEERTAHLDEANACLRTLRAPKWADRAALTGLLLDTTMSTGRAGDESFREAERLLDELAREHPAAWQVLRLQGVHAIATGLRSVKSGFMQRAVQEHAVAVKLVRQLARMDPENASWSHAEGRALFQYARTLGSAQRTEDSIRVHVEAADVLRKLVQLDAKDRDWSEDLRYSLIVLSEMWVQAGDRDRGVACLREALEVARTRGMADAVRSAEARIRALTDGSRGPSAVAPGPSPDVPSPEVPPPPEP